MKSLVKSSLFVAAAFFSLSGCSTLAPLSGSASMTIDVDVYKGPLSEDYFLQFGQLEGLVEDFRHALRNLNSNYLALARSEYLCPVNQKGHPKCKPCDLNKRECHVMGSLLDDIRQILAIANCSPVCQGVGGKCAEAMPMDKLDETNPSPACINGQLTESCQTNVSDRTARREACLITATDENEKEASNKGKVSERRKMLIDMGRLSMRARARAVYWAESLITYSNVDRATRNSIVTLANVLAEYGNQISSATDALAKRAGMYDIVKASLEHGDWCKGFGGTDGKCDENLLRAEAAFRSATLLPPSVMLRDSQPTKYINLYTWNRAGGIEPWENFILYPIEALSSESTANRVRATEQVFEDRYWSRINSVFASGRGDVNMAFVRDGVGNWGLKSFSNDPGKLLSAYGKVMDATVEAITDALKKGAVPALGLTTQLSALTSGAMTPKARDVTKTSEVSNLHDQVESLFATYQAKVSAIESGDLKETTGQTITGADLINRIKQDLQAEKKALKKMEGAGIVESPSPIGGLPPGLNY